MHLSMGHKEKGRADTKENHCRARQAKNLGLTRESQLGFALQSAVIFIKYLLRSNQVKRKGRSQKQRRGLQVR